MCTKEGKTMTNLISVIKQIVTANQRKNGLIITSKDDEKTPNADDFMKTLAGKDLKKELKATKNGPTGYTNKPLEDPKIDGYWVKLQGWSSCSLKCGPGGTQSFHRQCIPPKNGGKPCEGLKVLTKPCNEHIVCPSTKKAPEPTPQEKEAAKPIVKVMPFSNRFIKYTKCIIKETDALIESYGENLGAPKDNNVLVQVPVRIIMNNRTLTVLEGTDYDNHLFTFNLKSSKFLRDINPNCWGIEEEKPTKVGEPKKMKFCPFGLRSNAKEWVEEWDYDYNLFKYQCSSPLDHKTFNNTMNPDGDDDDDLNNQMDNFKADLIRDKERKMQKAAEEDEVKNNEEKLNGLELEAIRKEFNMEEMLEKDEAQREKDDIGRVKEEVEKEKEKRACLLKTIKEKEMENQYNMMKEESSADLEEEKKNVKNDIIVKRNALSDKLNLMRRRAERRMRKYKQELKGVKSKISDDANSAYHKGGFDCIFQSGDQNYCKARFIKNPVKFGDCIKSIHNRSEWCGVCCKEEIGSFYTAERSGCMRSCDPPHGEHLNSASGGGVPDLRWKAAIQIDDGNALDASKASVQ